MLLLKEIRQHINLCRNLAAVLSRNARILCAGVALLIMTAAVVAVVFVRPAAVRFGHMLWGCGYNFNRPVANCNVWSEAFSTGYAILVPVIILLLALSASYAAVSGVAKRMYGGDDYVTQDRIDLLKDRSVDMLLLASIFLASIFLASTIMVLVVGASFVPVLMGR